MDFYRFVVAGNPTTLATFEEALFGPFQVILQQDVDRTYSALQLQPKFPDQRDSGVQFLEFIPYVLQILAQMLELHTAKVPEAYAALLPLLLTPVVWQQKGSVPALVRLIKAYLVKDAAKIILNGQLQSILAVVQHRLIPSKLNDLFGLELLETIILHIQVSELQKHFGVILMTLLNRLQLTRTDKYTFAFVRFLCFMMAVPVEGLNPSFLVNAIQTIQHG
jgi:exportin-2 (importin alpha re-exporter)